MGFIGKAALAAIWLILLPCGAGIGLLKRDSQANIRKAFLTGTIFLFAAAELLTLPMIFLDLPLHVLSFCYALVSVAAAGYGLWCLRRERNGWKRNGWKTFLKAWKQRHSFWLVSAIILIGIQIAAVSILAHMDADDAFYVATATTAVHTDTIFSVNPYTGFAYTKLPSRYVLSPFPVFLAVISQLCGSLHPAILAHLIFPAVFVMMAYLVIYQFAELWFEKDADARGIFMILVCVLTWFSGFSVYSSGNFEMVRIWQGKALLASALLPLTIWFCIKTVMSKKAEEPWLFLVLTNISCCLVSSMGIMLCPLVIGIFAFLSCIWYRDGKRFAKAILCCLPSLVLGVVYLMIR